MLLLQLVLGHILLIICRAASSHANKTIRIGYTTSYMQYPGAINVAIDNAQRQGILRDHRHPACPQAPSMTTGTLRDFRHPP